MKFIGIFIHLNSEISEDLASFQDLQINIKRDWHSIRLMILMNFKTSSKMVQIQFFFFEIFVLSHSSYLLFRKKSKNIFKVFLYAIFEL